MKTEVQRDIDQIITERLTRKMEDIWPIGLVLDITKNQLKLLPPRLRVSIEQLIPHNTYEKLSAGERSHIGKCISLLVSQELLHLDRLNPTGVTKRYLTR